MSSSAYFELMKLLWNKRMSSENPSNLPSLGRSFSDKVKPWINIIDQLRSKGVDEHVSLPTIAVMGDQSSGKSSVLEAVTGVCLPRGNDIVTRCPLELKMESHPGQWTARLSYFHPTERITIEKTLMKPEHVSDAILAAQRVIAGERDDVRSDLISLHVKASDAPDLTVIDLPGIVHTRKRTQSSNIIQCINSLLESYMKKEDTIILAVLPANVDLATCAVLEMANKYDPQAQRTIAVITKTDAVYDNSSKQKLCETIQDGNLHNISQYFFVRNRTNEELLNKVSLSVAIKNEADFLQHDPIYSRLSKHNLGIPNLTSALTVRLVDAIKERFPQIENEINQQRQKTVCAMHALPPSMPDNDVGRIMFYTTTINEFISKLKVSLVGGQDGCYWHSMEKEMAIAFDKMNLNKNGLLQKYMTDNKSNFPTIYSRWRIIYEQYSLELNQTTELYLTTQKKNHLQTLDKVRGRELPTFLNFEFFQNIVLQCLALYKPIAEQCLLKMKENLKSMLICFIKEHLQQYEIIQKYILLVATETLCEISNEAEERINFLFSTEATVYTRDERYMDVFKNFSGKSKSVTPTGTTTKDQRVSYSSVESQAFAYQTKEVLTQKCALVDNLFDNLNSYLHIVVSRLSDYLPAILMNILHKQFLEKFQDQLLAQDRNKQVLQYLAKPDPFERKREYLMKKIESLNHGVELLRKFANNNMFE